MLFVVVGFLLLFIVVVLIVLSFYKNFRHFLTVTRGRTAPANAMPLHTCTPSDSSFWTDVAEALVTPTGTSAFLLEDVNRYCDVTETECFDGKLVLQASAVEMIEPKQMDEHTAGRILGHLLC